MRQALEMALEALEKTQNEGYNLPGSAIREAISAIKEVLAQPEQETPKGWKPEIWKSVTQLEQEPVQWSVDWGKADDIPCVSIIKRLPDGGIEVIAVEYAPYSYTIPPQRKPLTDEQLKAMSGNSLDIRIFKEIARAIEAAHGIKE